MRGDIPTEPIGSLPRTPELLAALAHGDAEDPALEPLYEAAVRDTVERLEAAGSPVVTDGEQNKVHNFWTYCVQGLPSTAPGGFRIPFSAGHERRMLRLTGGPFRYRRPADTFLDRTLRYAQRPVKQAVISPSALSLMYPADPRLAVEIDPSGHLLNSFIELNNLALSDDTTTSRDTAFAKIEARVRGTRLAAEILRAD